MRNKPDRAVEVVTDPLRALAREVHRRQWLEACAESEGISHQTLSKQLHPEEGEPGIALRRAARLQAFMQTSILAECFAARSDGLFVPLPPVQAGGDVRVLQRYAALVKEFSEFSAAFSDAVADGSVDRVDLERFRKELRDVYTAGEQLVLEARDRFMEAKA